MVRPLSPALLLPVALLAIASQLCPAPALGQGAVVSSAPELARAAGRLKPGEWIWAPSIATSGPVLVYVDLSHQLATVYRNGVRIGVSTISTGKDGHETPTGVFTILQKDANHRSNKYNSAPMPFAQRLTWDGVALHAGGLPGYPESHGCVHLPMAFARALFGITALGVTVVIEGNAANHVTTTDASLLVPPDLSGQAADRSAAQRNLDTQQYSWTPQIAPTGPLTIIVSKKDQMIVALRNGKEIGRSVARINDDDPGSHVISYTVGRDGKPHWIYVGLPGHDADAGHELDEATINRVQMPRAFYAALKEQIRPGATILVTMSPVGGGNTGEHLTILDAVTPAL
jgi:hypothetical protein